MGQRFEERREAELAVTPQQVWEAIATGPGIDSWFMGRNQVEPGEGGTVRMQFGDYRPVSTVTGWEPGRRLAYGDQPAEDGRFVGYEFLIEGRTGSTVVRMVTSGFLPGDDWQDEFDAMTRGGEMFFHTLVEYLTHFAGRTAVPVTAFGPPVDDWAPAWATLYRALGVTGPVATPGQQVRCAPDGVPPLDGEVYFANPHTLGFRTADGLYRFLQGFHGPMIAAHHLFSPTELSATEAEHAQRAWQAWLAGLFR